MEGFLPSEVARLILGFLKEIKCEKSWKIFLEECSDLQEYNLLCKKGKVYSTNVNGKSLLNILEEYCTLKNVSEKINSDVEFSDNVYKEKDMLEKSVRNAVKQVILDYLPCFCRNNQAKCDLPADVTQKDYIFDHNLDKSNELEKETEKMDQSNNTVIFEEYNSAGNYDSSIGSNVQSKSSDCDSNSLTEDIIPKSSHKFDGLDHNSQPVEQSVPDKIYMLDTIKVEKNSEDCTFLAHKFRDDCLQNKENDSQTPSNDSGRIILSHPTENKSVAEESSSKVVSTTSNQNHHVVESCETMQSNDCSLSELLKKTIKVEPDSSVNSINQTEGSNRHQNNRSLTLAVDDCSSLAETNETAFCNIQSTRDSDNNLATFVNLINSQPGYAIHPLATQSLPVSNMSYPSLQTYFVQNCPPNGSLLPNNPQYSFIINAPAAGTATTLPVAMPHIISNNIGPTLTSITSLSSDNLPSVLSISNNSSPNINAADSSNSCVNSQTDSTSVLSSAWNVAKAVLDQSTGKNNASKSKPLTCKSAQTTTLPVAMSHINSKDTGPMLTSVTSLSSQNLPSILSISNNSSPNINAADSTDSCGNSQTDSTLVLSSVCRVAKAVLDQSAGKNNASKSKLLTRKSAQTATLPVAMSHIISKDIGPTLTSVTSLSSQNVPSILSISSNLSPDVNAADSTDSCGNSQTDSTPVLNSVCSAAKAMLVPSAGNNNASKSKLTRKSGQKRNCAKKGNLNNQKQLSCSMKKNKYENLAEWHRKLFLSGIAERENILKNKEFLKIHERNLFE